MSYINVDSASKVMRNKLSPVIEALSILSYCETKIVGYGK